MIAAVLAMMLGVATPATGQATPPTPAQQIAIVGQALAAHGMSPAGVAKVKASLQANMALVPGLIQRVQQTTLAIRAAATANPFNPSGFESAMQARKAAVVALASAQENAKIGMYQGLTPADKKAFAITFAGGPPAGAR